METIIEDMERAFENINNADIQEQAKSTVSDTKTTMEGLRDSLDNDIKTNQERLEKIRDDLADAATLYGEGADNVERLHQQESNLIDIDEELNTQRNDYQTALRGVVQYENLLRRVRSNSTSTMFL